MWTVDVAFLAALTRSHSMVVVAKSYLEGVELGTLPLTAGDIRVSARSQVRRTANLLLPEATWTDLLAPTGVEVRVWRTIFTVGTYPLVPVFCGRVEKRRKVARSGLMSVECWDRFAGINDDAFDLPRPAPAGALISTAMAGLIQETYPTAQITVTATSPATVPDALTWDSGDGSRGRAIDRMGLAIGAEAVAMPDGSFLIRNVPTFDDTPVWTVATGSGGVIVSDSKEESRTGVANRWIITGNASGAGQSVRQVVTLGEGPLRYGGPYGRVTRTYTDPMISTGGQGALAGEAILARVRGIARQRTLDVVANPALEAGDVLVVTTAEGTEAHLADDFTLPLTVDPPTMTISSRSEV